jgi:hypothetical protein
MNKQNDGSCVIGATKNVVGIANLAATSKNANFSVPIIATFAVYISISVLQALIFAYQISAR